MRCGDGGSGPARVGPREPAWNCGRAAQMQGKGAGRSGAKEPEILAVGPGR